MILFEGEVESKFFLIIEGRVKVSRFTEDGEEAIFAFLGEGDFFGELSIFEDQVRDSNVITIESSRILVIHRSEFLNLMNTYSQIYINLLKEMTQKIRRRNAHIKNLTIRDATGKVAHTILRLADDYGAINLGKIEMKHKNDNTPPEVVETDPPSGEDEISEDFLIDAELKCTFSEEMVPASLNEDTFTLKTGTTAITGTVTYDLATWTATFKPDGKLSYFTNYTATIRADVEDRAGNTMAADYSWSFRTERGPLVWGSGNWDETKWN